MENSLQILKQDTILNRQFNIYGTKEEPLFLAKDVAEMIEYSKTSQGYYNVSKMLMTVDDDEKMTITNGNSGGKKTFLTENGLYEVLMQSRKEIAKVFKKQVKTILKDIRKHGIYATDAVIEKTLGDPDYMIELLQHYKQEKEQRQAAEAQIEADKPKVIFADAVATSKSSILVGELAKILKQNGINIGQQRLFKWLRQNGCLVKRGGSSHNMPTQRAMELNLFEIKETSITHSDGHVTVNKTPKVTGKGQAYFINKFLNDVNF